MGAVHACMVACLVACRRMSDGVGYRRVHVMHAAACMLMHGRGTLQVRQLPRCAMAWHGHRSSGVVLSLSEICLLLM